MIAKELSDAYALINEVTFSPEQTDLFILKGDANNLKLLIKQRLTGTADSPALMTGVWRKVAAIAAFALQGFFTILTIVLVVFNPEMDCGCFGNVAHLSHIQSLAKNIVLCLLLVGAFVPLRELGVPMIKKYVSFSIVTLSLILFTAAFSFSIIPLDFLPLEKN